MELLKDIIEFQSSNEVKAKLIIYGIYQNSLVC